jgi:hypothetical protein
MLGIQWHWENLNPPQETRAIVESSRPAELIEITDRKYTEQVSSDPNHDLALADIFGMSAHELKEEISNVKVQRGEQDKMKNTIEKLEKENAALMKKADELDKTIKTLKYNETEHDNKLKKLEEYLDSLKSRFDDRENEDVDEVDDEEEPGIALEDQLRITEQSAKAIDLLSNHLLSTVWQPCSKNTFGNAVT